VDKSKPLSMQKMRALRIQQMKEEDKGISRLEKEINAILQDSDSKNLNNSLSALLNP